MNNNIRLLLVVGIFIPCCVSCATNKDHVLVNVKYSAIISDLESPFKGGDGWKEVKSTRSIGSALALYASWGPAWYEDVDLGVSSSSSTNPLSNEKSDNQENLSMLTASFGKKSKQGFYISFFNQQFDAEAVVTDADKLKRENTFLAIGEKFEVGTEVGMLTVRAKSLGNKGYVGVGIGKIATKGIKGVNPIAGSDEDFEFGRVEEWVRETGIAIEGSYSISTHANSTNDIMRFPVFEYINSLSGDRALSYLKLGTEFVLVPYTSNHLEGEITIGAYTWRITQDVSGFDSLQPVVGGSIGIGINYIW